MALISILSHFVASNSKLKAIDVLKKKNAEFVVIWVHLKDFKQVVQSGTCDVSAFICVTIKNKSVNYFKFINLS